MCNITYYIVHCCYSFLQKRTSLEEVPVITISPSVSLTPAPGITFTCSLGGISHFAINTLTKEPYSGWNCHSITYCLVPAKLLAMVLPLAWEERIWPFKVFWGHISLTHTPLPATLSLRQKLKAHIRYLPWVAVLCLRIKAPDWRLKGVHIRRCEAARRSTGSETLEIAVLELPAGT